MRRDSSSIALWYTVFLGKERVIGSERNGNRDPWIFPEGVYNLIFYRSQAIYSPFCFVWMCLNCNISFASGGLLCSIEYLSCHKLKISSSILPRLGESDSYFFLTITSLGV